MRWSWISKSLIQVQKEEKSSLIELIDVYASHPPNVKLGSLSNNDGDGYKNVT